MTFSIAARIEALQKKCFDLVDQVQELDIAEEEELLKAHGFPANSLRRDDHIQRSFFIREKRVKVERDLCRLSAECGKLLLMQQQES